MLGSEVLEVKDRGLFLILLRTSKSFRTATQSIKIYAYFSIKIFIEK